MCIRDSSVAGPAALGHRLASGASGGQAARRAGADAGRGRSGAIGVAGRLARALRRRPQQGPSRRH
eukprot:9940012-Alexandrium_andersonii.AAC.1